MNNTIIQKGDIFYANLGETVGSEQSGIRPVLVIQNNVGNKYSPTLIITPLTSKAKKLAQPTHVTQILNPLIKCGFQIEAIEEAMPPADMMGMPGMCDEMRRPMMLLVKVKKV
jgi:mRNA-degrading endonuclease toxin of MazEF toxin-antitoxin module